MTRDVLALEGELRRLLQAAGTACEPCQLDVGRLKGLVIEYLNDIDSELAAFPHLAVKPHWNLWQWDEPGSPDRDAFFAAVIVRPHELEVIAACGRQQSVREFVDSDFPDCAGQVLTALARLCPYHFSSVRIEGKLAEEWLALGLGLRG